MRPSWRINSPMMCRLSTSRLVKTQQVKPWAQPDSRIVRFGALQSFMHSPSRRLHNFGWYFDDLTSNTSNQSGYSTDELSGCSLSALREKTVESRAKPTRVVRTFISLPIVIGTFSYFGFYTKIQETITRTLKGCVHFWLFIGGWSVFLTINEPRSREVFHSFDCAQFCRHKVETL